MAVFGTAVRSQVGGTRPRLRVILREPEGRVELFVVEARSAEHQKAPQAGSTESLMYLAKSKELFLSRKDVSLPV